MSKSNRRAFDKWLKKIEYVKGEFPFGPLQEFRDEIGRLHRDDGPAYVSPSRCIHYREGRKHGIDVDMWGSMTFFFEGIMVPRKYVMDPDSINFDEVMGMSNQEVRYAGIRLYGFDRMLEEDRFEIIDEDEPTGMLLLEQKGVFSDPLRVLSVFNSTPEPDGSTKRYFLNVPPDMRTAKQAVAWTFRKDSDEYAPAQET